MSNSNVIRKNLGPVTAYKYAVYQGYTGTEQEFAALMASYATVAEEAESAKDDAIDAKTAAEAAQAAAEAAASQAEGAIEVDDTLSVEGRAADAKVTGDAIANVKEELNSYVEAFTVTPEVVATNNIYLSSDGNSYNSSSWTAKTIKLGDENYISNLVIATNSTSFLACAFYNTDTISSDSFISGVQFTTIGENTFKWIAIPSTAVICVIATRTATQESYSYEFVTIPKINDEFTALEKLENDVTKLTDNANDRVIFDAYNLLDKSALLDGMRLRTSRGSRGQLIDANALYVSTQFMEIPEGSSQIRANYVADKIILYDEDMNIVSGVTTNSEYYAMNIADGCKYIAFTWLKTAVDVNKLMIVMYDSSKNRIVNFLKNTRYVPYIGYFNPNAVIIPSHLIHNGCMERIYYNVPNSNDFTFIKDEIWFGTIVDVATNHTIVHRYKFVHDTLVKIMDLDTDFGHLNTVDYNEDTDCLIFGNGANSAETEGNYFAVIKNPLSLSGTVSLDDVAIKYPVDIGYKVQAMWGGNNFGKNNIVWLLSNAVRTITKVLLLRNSNGDFNGQYVVLETYEYETGTGANGGDYWNGYIYHGCGFENNYHLERINTSDYTRELFTEKGYNDDGTEMVGTIQGVYIDSRCIWLFCNSTSGNYLTQYNR